MSIHFHNDGLLFHFRWGRYLCHCTAGTPLPICCLLLPDVPSEQRFLSEFFHWDRYIILIILFIRLINKPLKYCKHQKKHINECADIHLYTFRFFCSPSAYTPVQANYFESSERVLPEKITVKYNTKSCETTNLNQRKSVESQSLKISYMWNMNDIQKEGSSSQFLHLYMWSIVRFSFCHRHSCSPHVVCIS